MPIKIQQSDLIDPKVNFKLKNEWLIAEKYLEGEWTKWNANNGYVNQSQRSVHVLVTWPWLRGGGTAFVDFSFIFIIYLRGFGRGFGKFLVQIFKMFICHSIFRLKLNILLPKHVFLKCNWAPLRDRSYFLPIYGFPKELA